MDVYEIKSRIDNMLAEAEAYKKEWHAPKRWRIAKVCNDLSIFDWWNENLSVSQLKQMRKFVVEAIVRGYDGYACFKVGAAGCSHGMWAYEQQSIDGYSPDGPCLFHSFRTGDNYYGLRLPNGNWVDGDLTLKQVDEIMADKDTWK